MKPAKWVGLAAVIVVGACGPGSNADGTRGASTAAFVEHDSAGILIAVTPERQARTALGWKIDTVPDLEIGASGESPGGGSAEATHAFHRIGGVRQLSDGRVVVLDGGSMEVRFFDSQGGFLNRFGRRGQGPGEFGGSPTLVPAFGGDSLLVFDTRPVRFHLLSIEDGGYRLIRPATWKGATPPLGSTGSNVLVELSHAFPSTVTGPVDLPWTFAWTDMVTGKRILLDSFLVRLQYATKVVDGIGWGGLIPFSPRPAAAVQRNSALITKGALPEIREYDVQGRLRGIIRIDEPLRRITDTDIQHYVEVTGEPMDPEIPIPDVMPTFESLVADDLGWLWAKTYERIPARRPTWVVFDGSGKAHGTVETPVGLRIHQIAADFILGVWTDEFDVEHVRRYRLDRRSSVVDG